VLVNQSFGGVYAAHDKALFVFELKAGFRVSKLISLKIGDVNQHGRLVDNISVARG
jgi:hypothetical protein